MLVGLKDILKIAEADKTAVGMFNGTGFDSIRAVIGAAEELNRPVIMRRRCRCACTSTTA